MAGSSSYYDPTGKSVTNGDTSDETDINNINTALDAAFALVEADVDSLSSSLSAIFTSFSPGGSFTGGTIYAAKIGRIVTLTWSGLTHASSFQVSSTATAVPAAYRPLVTQELPGPNAGGLYDHVITVTTGGYFVMSYYDGGGASPQTAATNSSISYISAS